MSNLHTRTRVVYFRVSEDEFREINQVCQERGARNLSELVRSAVRELILGKEQHPLDSLTERLRQLEQTVEKLNGTVTTFTNSRFGPTRQEGQAGAAFPSFGTPRKRRSASGDSGDAAVSPLAGSVGQS